MNPAEIRAMVEEAVLSAFSPVMGQIQEMSGRIAILDMVLGGGQGQPEPGATIEKPRYVGPLGVLPQGGLSVKFKERQFAAPGVTGTPSVYTVGGGSAVTLTDNSTNYCWLEFSYTRANIEGMLYWNLTGVDIHVETTGTYQPTGYDNSLPGNSTCKRVVKFCEIVTASGRISSITPKRTDRHPEYPCALPESSTDKQLLQYNNSSSEWQAVNSTSVTAITDFQVDGSNKKLQKKTTAFRAVNVGTQSSWIDIHTGDEC